MEFVAFVSAINDGRPVQGLTVYAAHGPASAILLRQPGADAAPLLVCIHGGGCNARYFDLRGFSTAAAARKRGMAVLLVNRPGFGGNPPLGDEHAIRDTAPLVRGFIEQVSAEHLGGSRDVVMIGHSIGGAIALAIASAPGELPLRGVAVSGIGDLPGPDVVKLGSSPAADVLAADGFAPLFLGPEGTYSWQGPVALRRASEPWRASEVFEVVHEWPKRWSEIARRIAVPVHLRLAEHDRIWETGPAAVERLGAMLVASPRVDAALLADGGHVYEIHKRGPELIESQLAFLQSCVATGGVSSPLTVADWHS